MRGPDFLASYYYDRKIGLIGKRSFPQSFLDAEIASCPTALVEKQVESQVHGTLG